MISHAKVHLQSLESQIPLQYHERTDLNHFGELISTHLKHEAEVFGANIAVLSEPDVFDVIKVTIIAFERAILTLKEATLNLHLFDLNWLPLALHLIN